MHVKTIKMMVWGLDLNEFSSLKYFEYEPETVDGGASGFDRG